MRQETAKNVERYVDVLIGRISKTFAETGAVDYFLCDRIERLLWPERVAGAVEYDSWLRSPSTPGKPE